MSNSKVKNKLELEDYLNNVDYKFLNSKQYKPSKFSTRFKAFIQLVNQGSNGNDPSPPAHLSMMDKLERGTKPLMVNICHRGFGKTTLCPEYLILYIAVFGGLPRIPFINGMIYVADSMENGAKSLRKNVEHRYYASDFLQTWIPKEKVNFTDSRISFENVDGHKFEVRLFGGKTNVRGIKIFGDRPQIAVLDDVVSDEDSRSRVNLESIRTNIYQGVLPALDPKNHLVIFNGTPFNKNDPLIEAVESGEWDTNVYPICEKFPCSKEDFVGSWEDRFSYEYVKSKYELAKGIGRLSAFYQEYMLQITSEEDRLIQDKEIKRYSRVDLLKKKDDYNFYITTDFATSTKQSADFSVISVWAYDKDGNWYWVDGMCERVSIDVSISKLFKFAKTYKPQQVGIEVTGQQGAFLTIIRNQMLEKDIWFNFASSHGTTPGIRPVVDKLSRLNLVVPLFKMGRVFFPEEMENTTIMNEFYDEIRLATGKGIKGKDDCLDTISMLGYLNPWKPSVNSIILPDEARAVPRRLSMYDMVDLEDFGSENALDSYIV